MKILKKIAWGLLSIIAILAVVYLSGPRISFEKYDNKPLSGTFSLEEVKEQIDKRNYNPLIKANNHEQLHWFDGIKKTEYAVVYLHGFSASHEEGAPIHRNVAKRYGANLFLSRLPRHGLNNEEAFEDLTPAMLVDYAKEAIKIGKSIGEKVILISCSTGGTLSAYLSAEDPEIFAQIMFAPNFALHGNTTKLLTNPWGLQIARKMKGGNYNEWNTPQVARPYWYHKYRLEGAVALQSLIDNTMKDEILSQIKQPLFVGYFYKDEETKDFTISTDRIEEVKPLLSTPPEMKVFKTYPDGNAHVFVSPFFNKNWFKAQEDVFEFLEGKLKLQAVAKPVLIEN